MRTDQIRKWVDEALDTQPVRDLHTHLYPPAFGTPVACLGTPTDPNGYCVWGIDELLTYHYLIAELFRALGTERLPYDTFFRMSKTEQADLIWQTLFIDRTPISEACRGVVTTLTRLGLNPNETSLEPFRKYFRGMDPNAHIDRVMELSNVESITMTNNVFDDNERQRWLENPGIGGDQRFKPVLRIDPLLVDWPSAARKLNAWGYALGNDGDAATIQAVKTVLRDWLDRMGAVYVAVSLPPAFRYSADSPHPVLEKAILPVCAERGLAFAMMIGCQRQVNPSLRDAGDMSGLADVGSVANLCRAFPMNRFLVTMLARENQHELCVAARKFPNLTVFGCWWFLNNPSLITEITRMRLELLGTTFIPQHSDARVLEQLLYKWDHSRRALANVLSEKYADLATSGWRVSQEQIAKDVRLLLNDNVAAFTGA